MPRTPKFAPAFPSTTLGPWQDRFYTQIGNSVIATAPAAPCLLASANFGTAGVSLTAGTTYWLVVTTSTASTQIGTTAVWWEANSSRLGVNFNDGFGWQASSSGGPGGFSVQ